MGSWELRSYLQKGISDAREKILADPTNPNVKHAKTLTDSVEKFYFGYPHIPLFAAMFALTLVALLLSVYASVLRDHGHEMLASSASFILLIILIPVEQLIFMAWRRINKYPPELY